MNIKITREIVKEIAGVRRTLKVGQVVEIRDPDAVSLIKHGYAEPFQDEPAPTAPEVDAAAIEEAVSDDKPVKRVR
ncbi:MAG: hypothetical protein IT320_20850 [Anaerolineae bacterium]|nr:hypothetical protein [Anaerolineae bacterium]